MKTLAIVLLLTFALIGVACSKPPILVSKEELLELSKVWKEPKVAIWYYWGSDEEFDYFLFRDIDGDKAYRVKKDEEVIESEFKVTSDRGSWRVMPWGPQVSNQPQNQLVESTETSSATH